MITHDTLTGLYNRTLLEEEVIKLERNRTFPVSIIIVDVDGLKIINDTRAMQQEMICYDVRRKCLSSRFAPMISLPESEGTNLQFSCLKQMPIRQEVIIRIQDSVSDHNKKYQKLPISLSYGAATGYQGNSLSQIFKDADKQMYENKTSKVTGLSKSDALVCNPAG